MRVAVVGGGMIGLLCAHHLSKRGADVVVLERNSVGEGCSAGNAGWVTPCIAVPLPAPGLRSKSLKWMLRPDSPLYIKPSAAPSMAAWLLSFWKHCNQRDFDRGTRALAELGSETMDLFDELSADGAEFEWREDGLLMIFRDQAEMDAELSVFLALDYGPLELLDPEALQRLEPSLSDGATGAIHVKPERVVRPESVCSGTARLLRSNGAEVIEGSAVTDLRFDHKRASAVVTNDGDVEADVFLVATGAEAARLSGKAGVSLPLQAGKGYSATVSRPEIEVRHPLYLSSTKIGMTPFDGALRIAGTMELSGINLRMDRRRLVALTEGAEREVPGALAGEGVTEWVGMRPITPDGLPILGRLPSTDNVYVATGHQMLGVTLAPSTGKAMAQLVLEGRSDVDLEPFAPGRF